MKNPYKKPKKRKKKKYKKITAENLYRPKRLTLRTFNLFISQFIDRFNWGCINEHDEKSFRFSQDWINLVPYKSYIKLTEKPRKGQYRDICLQDHLEARQDPEGFVFCTTSPYSDLCMLCGDIDPIPGYGYNECLQALYFIRNKIFPDIYWEPSTTGRGIHFYIIIDFSTFVPHCGNNYDLFHRINCNRIIEQYSELLSAVVDSTFFCKFDKFCGTYPVYSYPLSSHIFLFRGDLGKLPCPQSDVDIYILSNIPILSYSDLGETWNYMQELLHDTGCHSNPSEPTGAATSSSIPYNILGRDFENMTKNDEYMRDDNSAFTRVRHSIQKLARELGRMPLYEEWNEYYEANECNTGEEDEQRKSRFEVVSKYVEKEFDPSKIGAIYHYGDFLDNLLNDITQEQINRIVEDHTNYRYKVTHQDLDVGLGAHWMAVRTHMQYGKQLSVPRDTIPALFKSLEDRGIIKRCCDLGKATAIRTVLQHMKYIKLIDPYFSWKKGDHISQRWGMDINFPKYDDYRLFCGDAEKMALRIKKMRDEGKGDLVKSYKFLPKVYREMFEG
jgi:hypothetical protein